ncbi:MAG TPA: hypothetical protein VNQ31_06960 [Sphingomonadaceae bacterium]|nr:hypothetical protein [Sphingomonadaceae bacterium]
MLFTGAGAPHMGPMQPPKPPFDFALSLDKLARVEPVRFDLKFGESLVQIGRAVAQIQANFGRVVQPLVAGFAEMFKDRERAEAVHAASWIPHPTTPLHAIEPDMPAHQIDALLAAHYRDNWPEVRAAMSQSVQATAIDAEAKATFEEALAAHDAGLYRSVVRLLFPEIERVARETVYGGSRKDVSGRRPKNNAGLADFREALMSELPVGVVLDTPFALSLVEKLYGHLYSYVPEDEAGLAVFERDPVPNRHASQHGYVTYSSAQNAINMLAMADFMFHVIMSANAYMDRLEAEAKAVDGTAATPRS